MALNAAAVHHHLDQALNSPLFRKAERQARFLRFVVDVALHSPDATIKEFDIGIAVYDRRPDYDPRTDPIVRVEAARLRARLREYYAVTPPDHVRIDLPKGGYLPLFIPLDEAVEELARDLSILVTPFRSLSADPSDQSFCDGLTEEVTHRLARDRRLRVITQSAARWLEQGEGRKSHFLLEGSVRQAGAEVRLTLHLLDLSGGGSTRLSSICQSTINDVFATQERLADEICGHIAAALDLDATSSGSIN